MLYILKPGMVRVVDIDVFTTPKFQNDWLPQMLGWSRRLLHMHPGAMSQDGTCTNYSYFRNLFC